MAGKILVLGATGNVGAPLAAELVARGEKVRAASRAAAPVPGAEAVRFDYAEPASFAPALDGVDRAFVVVPTGFMEIVERVKPFVAEAAARNVKVVLQTALGVDADDNIPYRQIELFLEKAGTPFVFLRPNWFSDNFHTFWRAGVQHGEIAVPAGEGKTSFIDARDIAASAAGALTDSRFDGRAFDLTGPAALGYGEAAGVLAKALGRPVSYRAIEDGEFVASLVRVGVPEAYAGLLASIFAPVRQGWTAGVTDAVQTLTGRAPRTLETYARDRANLLKG